jgi:hypothetical protein
MKLPAWWIPWAREEAASPGHGWLMVKTAAGRRVTVMLDEIRARPDDAALAEFVCARCDDEDRA